MNGNFEWSNSFSDLDQLRKGSYLVSHGSKHPKIGSHIKVGVGGVPPITHAVRKGDYKLIKFQDDKSIFLFNLVKDKMEQLNLATQKPKKAKELVGRNFSNHF